MRGKDDPGSSVGDYVCLAGTLCLETRPLRRNTPECSIGDESRRIFFILDRLFSFKRSERTKIKDAIHELNPSGFRRQDGMDDVDVHEPSQFPGTEDASAFIETDSLRSRCFFSGIRPGRHIAKSTYRSRWILGYGSEALREGDELISVHEPELPEVPWGDPIPPWRFRHTHALIVRRVKQVGKETGRPTYRLVGDVYYCTMDGSCPREAKVLHIQLV
jgi:hypothetical protein